jgi:hypothetical protein
MVIDVSSIGNSGGARSWPSTGRGGLQAGNGWISDSERLIHGAKACAVHGASFELVNLAKELRSDIDALRLTGRLVSIPERVGTD